MKSTSRFVLGLALLASSSSFAGGYSLDANWDVPPPPRPGSAESKRDFQELRRWQNVRTEAECATARAQNFMSAEVLFGPSTGLLTKREFAALEHLLTEVIETAENEARPYKEEFRRPRPYDTDSEISPCIRKPGGAKSYPSSHAAAGMAGGLVLADLFPARAEEFRAAGIQIGTNRVLGGVHHPSDVETGQSIGEQIHQALESSREFLRDYSAAEAKF